ncbi:ATP-binding protein [Streptomyces polygonati]|uniref:ATP-binding protein n=1 Tax=Streptomyces polygonati TaxID=1617087 RepID=A0ABV8HRF7_9ACTN
MEVRGSVPPDQAPAARPYEGVFRFTAPAIDASVPQIRHSVRELIADLGVPLDADLRYGLLLIVSELVTNAVKHAAVLSPRISVELTVGERWIRVAVEDNHPYRPKALAADHARTGGRGLLLVKSVTDEAGGSCDSTPTASGGKVIWATLPLRAAEAD